MLLADPTNWLIELDARGPASAFPEYPWPAVALLDLPLRLEVPTVLHYYAIIVCFMLAVDALFAWLLWRSAGARMSRGLWLWLAVRTGRMHDERTAERAQRAAAGLRETAS